jgi:hypothetical protein
MLRRILYYVCYIFNGKEKKEKKKRTLLGTNCFDIIKKTHVIIEAKVNNIFRIILFLFVHILPHTPPPKII